MWGFVVKIKEGLRFGFALNNQQLCVLCTKRSPFSIPPLGPRAAHEPADISLPTRPLPGARGCQKLWL